jgi:tetratricopeptide (TPR) repeat protein
LAIRQALDGPESLRVAEDLNYLAMMVDAQGRVDEAETLQRQAIAIFEARVDKADKGSFAKSLNNLGLLVERKGQMEEAEILTRKAVQYAEEGFGPDHPKTLICVGTMAGLLEKKGDYAAAYTLLKRAREGCERTLGPDHPLTLRAFSQHAYGLRKTGFAAEAEPVDRHAVAGSIKVFGKSHPLVIHRSNNLVLTLVLLGKLEQAREVLAGNELSKFKPYENLTPRITFLRYVMELLSASGCELAADLLGRLKFHFARDPLPVFTNIDPYWDIGYFIDALQPKLKSLSVDLLRALLAVLNARARSSADVPLAALDEFPAWQNAISVPFE